MVEKTIDNEKSIEKTIENHKNFRRGDNVAVTINPSNRYQFGKLSINNRLQKFRSHMLVVLGPLQQQFKYKFNMEISKFGRVHLHGYVKLKKVLEFSQWVYNIKNDSKEYHLDIDSINDLDKWIKYCRKDEDIMTYNIDKPRIIYPEPNESIIQHYKKIDESLMISETSDDTSDSEYSI